MADSNFLMIYPDAFIDVGTFRAWIHSVQVPSSDAHGNQILSRLLQVVHVSGLDDRMDFQRDIRIQQHLRRLADQPHLVEV